jgi:hypothetical protein
MLTSRAVEQGARPCIVERGAQAVSAGAAIAIRIRTRAGRARSTRDLRHEYGITLRQGNRHMTVRDLRCWPPKWRRAGGVSAEAVGAERGILIATRWEQKTQSLALVMEDDGDRHYAVLEDKVPVLSKVCLLLDWHIGRSLAKIGSLEIAPLTSAPRAIPGAGV